MNEWIDIKYLGLIQSRLERFAVKQNQPYLSNFRCPFCGDSKKNKWKARGYLFSKPGGLFYKCHNCNHSTNFGKLLEEVDPTVYREYALEKFKEGKTRHANTVPNFENFTPKFGRNLLHKITVPAKGTVAELYLEQRKVPKYWWDRLFYVDDVQKLEELSPKYEGRIIGNEGRLVIPFYDKEKQLVGVTCRALGDERLRYITVRINEDKPMIFNLDQVHDGKVYVTEGPIDAMFLPNSVAVGNSDLNSINTALPKENVVLVFDNQPRNPQLIDQMFQAGEEGYKVVVWPERIPYKDINEMVINGIDNVQKIIDNNTFEGLELIFKISDWRKV